MFIKALDETKEKLPPKYTPKKYILGLKIAPPNVLSPNPIEITLSLGPLKYCSHKPYILCKYFKILLDII